MQSKEKIRMCIVCRGQSDKKTLLRIVKNKDGEIFVDKTGKANGRGAYVCKSKDCFEKLCKQKALNRAFKTEVPQEIYQKIGEEIEQN
ncbi:MAG: YlxR family protein [Clostridiales bacterium]|nr:YlxR family protein [Clostridiales bacterium]